MPVIYGVVRCVADRVWGGGGGGGGALCAKKVQGHFWAPVRPWRGLYYEYRDKSSRLLAHQLRRQTASRIIFQINSNQSYFSY